MNPLTGVCAAILGGSVLRVSGVRRASSRDVALTALNCGLAVAVGAAVFIGGLHPYLVERGAFQARQAGSAQYEAYVLAHANDQDPAWATKAMDILVKRGLSDRSAAVVAVRQSDADLVATVTKAASWSSQSVGSLIQLETLRQYLEPKPDAVAIGTIASLGERSDPVTGLWRFWAGSVALQMKRPDLANAWARESLAKEPSAAAAQLAKDAETPARQ
jgi:hypothetical protein